MSASLPTHGYRVSLWQLLQIVLLNSGITKVFKLPFNAVLQMELKR